MPDGGISLNWDAFGGNQYTVQQTDNLVGHTWVSAPGTWPISSREWTTPDLGSVKRRFYRILGE
jgi:hypothetical protein